MTLLTQENLIATCEAFLTLPNPTWAQIMRVVGPGASVSTAFNWRARCKKDKDAGLEATSVFFFNWRETDGWWIDHIVRASQEFNLKYVQTLKAQALSGIEVPVRDSMQAVRYKLDPRFVGHSDDYVREVLGMGDWEEVEEHHRLLKDADGLPVVDTVVQHIPAQLRLRVAEAADSSFRPTSHQTIDVALSAKVVHQQLPFSRKPGEQRADAGAIAEMREIAKLSPEDRRKRMGTAAYPMNAAGQRTIPKLSPPLHERPDDQGEIAKPNDPKPFQRPSQPPVDPNRTEGQPRPSYARPLDTAGRGRGEIPPGGFKVA